MTAGRGASAVAGDARSALIRYRSTANGGAPGASFREALLRGQAPGSGLFVPERIPRIEMAALRGADFADRAHGVLSAFLDDELGRGVTAELCRQAFDFPVPLTRLDADTWLLELFHGPTAAFKDFGARFLARALQRLHPAGSRLTVLVATSGDTGSAVAHAFAGLPGTRVLLLYPAGKVSPGQEAQILTAAANVQPLRVAGAFDDCQAMVKSALGDADLVHDLGLIAANSINIGRLLPQIPYYVHALLEMESAGEPPLVVVPSGNLGNLTAGLYAQRAGARAGRFLAASNANDVFPRALRTGKVKPKPVVPTLSNAMDVGNPSNAARILALYAGRFADLRRDVIGESVGDEETLRTMREIHAETGRLVCPHTAVALAARRRFPQARPALVLATAHPGKFAEIVERATGATPEQPPALRLGSGIRRTPVDLSADPAAFCAWLRA
jgi:threonine synthase